MKTIEEYFNELPEDLRERAFKNAGAENLKSEALSLHTAIKHGFVWATSNEGFMYWKNVFDHYEMEHSK